MMPATFGVDWAKLMIQLSFSSHGSGWKGSIGQCMLNGEFQDGVLFALGSFILVLLPVYALDDSSLSSCVCARTANLKYSVNVLGARNGIYLSQIKRVSFDVTGHVL